MTRTTNLFTAASAAAAAKQHGQTNHTSGITSTTNVAPATLASSFTTTNIADFASLVFVVDYWPGLTLSPLLASMPHWRRVAEESGTEDLGADSE